MAKPRNARRLLTSSVRVATLVCLGVAETACNLQISARVDSGPRPDAGATDAGADASIDDAAVTADGAIPADARASTDAADTGVVDGAP